MAAGLLSPAGPHSRTTAVERPSTRAPLPPGAAAPDVQPVAWYSPGRGPAPLRRSYDLEFDEGLLQEQLGQSHLAGVIYQRLVTDFPYRYEAYHRLGALDHHARQYRSAQDWYIRAYRLDSDDPRLLNDLGRCLLAQEKWALAQAVLKQAVTLSPEDARSRQDLAVAQARLRGAQPDTLPVGTPARLAAAEPRAATRPPESRPVLRAGGTPPQERTAATNSSAQGSQRRHAVDRPGDMPAIQTTFPMSPPAPTTTLRVLTSESRSEKVDRQPISHRGTKHELQGTGARPRTDSAHGPHSAEFHAEPSGFVADVPHDPSTAGQPVPLPEGGVEPAAGTGFVAAAPRPTPRRPEPAKPLPQPAGGYSGHADEYGYVQISARSAPSGGGGGGARTRSDASPRPAAPYFPAERRIGLVPQRYLRASGSF